MPALEMCSIAVLVATARQCGTSCFVSSTEISGGVTTLTVSSSDGTSTGVPESGDGLGQTLRPRLTRLAQGRGVIVSTRVPGDGAGQSLSVHSLSAALLYDYSSWLYWPPMSQYHDL